MRRLGAADLIDHAAQLGGLVRVVVVGDEIATRGSRSMLRAFSEPSAVKKTTLSPSSPAQIAAEWGEPSWHQRGEVDEVRALEQLPHLRRELSHRREPIRSTRGGGSTGPSPVVKAARTASSALAADCSSRAWTVARRRGVLAEAGDVGEADRGVDVVGLAPAAAAELHHDEAERADVDARRPRRCR